MATIGRAGRQSRCIIFTCDSMFLSGGVGRKLRNLLAGALWQMVFPSFASSNLLPLLEGKMHPKGVAEIMLRHALDVLG